MRLKPAVSVIQYCHQLKVGVDSYASGAISDGACLFASEPEVTHSDKKKINSAETDKLKLRCTLKSQSSFHRVVNNSVQEISPENVQ